MKKQHDFWFKEYLENCRQLNRSGHTILNYGADLKKFFSWYEATYKTLIVKTDGNTITKYSDFLGNGGSYTYKVFHFGKAKSIFLFLSKKKYSVVKVVQIPMAVSSRRRHLSAVKNFFEFLKQSYEDHSNLFQKNPVKSKIHAIKLKDIDVNSTKLLNKDDWEKLCDTIFSPKERLMINLLYFGALRLSELASLKIENFNEKNDSLTFVRKGGDIHTLAIQSPNMIFDDLRKYLASRKSDSIYLFPGKISGHLTSRAVYKSLMKLLQFAGCKSDITPHSFRKACATNLYDETKDLLFVRDYLNHKDAKVTQTYIDN